MNTDIYINFFTSSLITLSTDNLRHKFVLTLFSSILSGYVATYYNSLAKTASHVFKEPSLQGKAKVLNQAFLSMLYDLGILEKNRYLPPVLDTIKHVSLLKNTLRSFQNISAWQLLSLTYRESNPNLMAKISTIGITFVAFGAVLIFRSVFKQPEKKLFAPSLATLHQGRFLPKIPLSLLPSSTYEKMVRLKSPFRN